MACPPLAGGRQVLAATQPLLWPLYLVWSGCVLAVWTLGIGEVELQDAVAHPDLRAALQTVLGFLDPLWITLGFYHIYSALALEQGLSRARRWMGYGLLLCILVAWLNSRTSWPMGPVHFTERLGIKVGPVPLCIPLLWLTVVFGARATAARLLGFSFPQAVPAVSAAIACASVLVIDPIAWKQRSWWLWYPAEVNAPSSAPWTVPVFFLVVSFAASAVTWEKINKIEKKNRSRSDLVVFAVLNAVAITGRMINALR